MARILPDELVLLLRTLTLTPEQFRHQQSNQKPPKLSFGLPEAMVLQKAVQVTRARYDTSIPQDQDILARLDQLGSSSPLDTSSRRQKMAVQVRIGEKEILESLSAKLDALVADLGSSSLKRDAAPSDIDPRKTKAQRT